MLQDGRPEAGTWRTVHTTGLVPVPRHVHSAVSYGNEMYVFAGYGNSGVLGDFVKFSFGRSGPTTVAISHLLY